MGIFETKEEWRMPLNTNIQGMLRYRKTFEIENNTRFIQYIEILDFRSYLHYCS